MQHFAVCTLLVGRQDGAWECHCAVCHRAVGVEAGGGDVQVSVPAHLLSALLLLTAHGVIPDPSSSFSLLAEQECSECFGCHLWDAGWSSAFPCYGTTMTNYRATACGGEPSPLHEHWRGDSPNAPWKWVLISAVKKGRKTFSHNLILCHCVKV